MITVLNALDEKYLLEIKVWLEEVHKCSVEKQGNWRAILSAFSRKELLIATIENKIVGFFALLVSQEVITIMVAEVHPDYRGIGVGSKILNTIIENVSERSVAQLELLCEPMDSEIFWRKMGFTTMKKSDLDTGGSTKLFMNLANESI